jgi:hypothetical protein
VNQAANRRLSVKDTTGVGHRHQFDRKSMNKQTTVALRAYIDKLLRQIAMGAIDTLPTDILHTESAPARFDLL